MNDTRNAEKENLDDDASNTLVIVLANYLKRIVIFKNHRVQVNIKGGGGCKPRGVRFLRLFLPVAEKKASMNYK